MVLLSSCGGLLNLRGCLSLAYVHLPELLVESIRILRHRLSIALGWRSVAGGGGAKPRRGSAIGR